MIARIDAARKVRYSLNIGLRQVRAIKHWDGNGYGFGLSRYENTVGKPINDWYIVYPNMVATNCFCLTWADESRSYVNV